jgi:hypothetical protein
VSPYSTTWSLLGEQDQQQWVTKLTQYNMAN